MRLYHGTKKKGLKEIIPASLTGNLRESRKTLREVGFYTSDFSMALEYAGNHGEIHEVEITQPQQYIDTPEGQRAKAKESIYISPGTEPIICTWYVKKVKRGAPYLYDRVYKGA